MWILFCNKITNFNLQLIFFFSNGSDELEEHEEQYNNERNKTIPPIPVNSHLHCHASTLDLPNVHDQNIDPKTQK